MKRKMDFLKRFWAKKPCEASSSRDTMTSGPCLLNDLLPSDDLLSEILLRVYDVRTLTRSCPLVSKRWLALTLEQSFWLEKCLHDGVTVPPVHLRRDYPFDYKLILIKQPYNRNLIRNPSGEEQLNGWQILQNGGSRWRVETPPVYCDLVDFPTAFASSYEWCVKEQKVDLISAGVEAFVLDEVKPAIVVSEWTVARHDCASEYRLKAWLNVVDATGVSQQSDEREQIVHMPQWSDGQWQKVEFIFKDYPKGTRQVVVRSSGKDSQFWDGHYGPKMAKASVTLVFD